MNSRTGAGPTRRCGGSAGAARVGQVRQESVEQPAGHAGGDHGVTAGDRADRGQHLGRWDAISKNPLAPARSSA